MQPLADEWPDEALALMSCDGKVRFSSWRQAKRIGERRESPHRAPYPCRRCRGFHLGRQRRDIKSAKTKHKFRISPLNEGRTP